MDDLDFDLRLSQIRTNWSALQRAHSGEAESATHAQQELMCLYSGAVYRYLVGFLRDFDAADDLAQEFALRFLRGDFRRVDPSRGRFRDYVKMVLRHLVADLRRRQLQGPRPIPLGGLEPAEADDALEQLDADFLKGWRQELLSRSWEALERLQDETRRLYYDVLRLRADHPEMRSSQMAEYLTNRLGRPTTAGAVRQTLSLARERYADFLLAEVEQTLDNPTPERVEQELIDLNLLTYCLPTLERRGWKTRPR